MSKKLIVLAFLVICSCSKNEPIYYSGSNVSIRIAVEKGKIYPIIEDRHIYCIDIEKNNNLRLVLNAVGADRLFDYTYNNIGKEMEMISAGQAYLPIKIMAPIGSGHISIGKVNEAQIKTLKDQLPGLFKDKCK